MIHAKFWLLFLFWGLCFQKYNATINQLQQEYTIHIEHNKTGLQVQPISRLDKMHIFHVFYAQALGQRTMHNIVIIDDSLVTFKLFHWFAIPRNPTMQFGILAMGSPAPRSSYTLKSGQTIISSKCPSANNPKPNQGQTENHIIDIYLIDAQYTM